MSFGYSISEFTLLAQLAFTTVQNARKASGAHDSLIREVSSLHIVLSRLQAEISKLASILNNPENGRRDKLATLARDCRRPLEVLCRVLEKYNKLGESGKKGEKGKKLWQKIKFGNGEMLDLESIRVEIAAYTNALTLLLNLLGLGSQGKVEMYMERNGKELRELKSSLNWVTAKKSGRHLRRELINEGISSKALGKYKRTIQNYVTELGKRGVLDDVIEDETELSHAVTMREVGRREEFSEASSPRALAFQSDRQDSRHKGKERQTSISGFENELPKYAPPRPLSPLPEAQMYRFIDRNQRGMFDVDLRAFCRPTRASTYGYPHWNDDVINAYLKTYDDEVEALRCSMKVTSQDKMENEIRAAARITAVHFAKANRKYISWAWAQTWT